jgi:hypothetical protein
MDVLGLVNVLILLLLVWKPSSCIGIHIHSAFFLSPLFVGFQALKMDTTTAYFWAKETE